MALFLRGNVWWMEYRTSKVRAVKSTGLKKQDRAKAKAVWQAWKLAFETKPDRAILEGLLDSVYGNSDPAVAVRLDGVWTVYCDWLDGKMRVISETTMRKRRADVNNFVAWAEKKGLVELGAVSVGVAREYVRSYSIGRANKTIRNTVCNLISVWKALGQMGIRVHNPWQAALPDDDGSSVALRPFTPDEEALVLAKAKEIGHGWYLASMISRWTGLRYGDVATLDWADIDLTRRVIETVPNKTRKHKVSVMVPISDALYEALSGVAPEDRDGFVLPEHAVSYDAHGFDDSSAFARVLEAAGIEQEHHTFHSWRHTFRTRLAEAGVSDDVARRLGGWTNLKMAAHYDHASHLDEMRSAIGRMEPK